mmetsp:Transcript_44303/g.94359  ORF Transcript_44303/g.94359 Transcript_44303/m.94359 type:complete len:200 (-) Transcript_44303:409-1008(-)
MACAHDLDEVHECVGNGDRPTPLLWAEMPSLADEEDWLALAMVRCHRQCNFLWGAVELVCDCSETTGVARGGAGCRFATPENAQNRVHTTAAEYVTDCLCYLDDKVKDNSLFVPASGVPRHPQFRSLCSEMAKRILRIYSHFEYAHAEQLKEANIWNEFRCQQRTMLAVAGKFELLELHKIQYIVYRDWKDDQLLRPHM